MEASDVKRLKELEDENRRLKQMYAELSLDNKILKDIIEKSCKASGAAGAGRLYRDDLCRQFTPRLQGGRYQ